MPEPEAAGREVPAANARYESYSHEAMAAEVGRGNEPTDAGQLGAQWQGLAQRLQESTSGLAGLAARSQDSWQGAAGDAVRSVLGEATGWLARSASVSSTVGESVAAQAEVAARARADMPPPVSYEPGEMIRGAAASGNVLLLAGLSLAMESRRQEAEAARIKAMDVMNTRDAALRDLVPHESFDPPPALGRS
ncbi:PPE domain-containing protein [Amycolatopsis sp. H20-H5]|uniref:PPE domain-containing protein n=1 Tax=Amycolatopsis sp. H20-H5 TaxID=3046309 RepID=UPI002DB5B900|nr:PPE domain-containing protein [Amycolatopsis sp. H20-H5]MEC3977657.1 PPE domain-containing protein [Amycolatopsis sp. H20-H5]